MATGVYAITCSANGKYYIGSTETSFEERWNEHTRKLKRNKHVNRHLQNAWNKYGKSSFKMIELAYTTPDMARKSEQVFLDAALEQDWDMTFNIATDAVGGDLGPEARAAIKKALANLEWKKAQGKRVAKRNRMLASQGLHYSQTDEGREASSERMKALHESYGGNVSKTDAWKESHIRRQKEYAKNGAHSFQNLPEESFKARYRKVVCPHCNREGSLNAMKRWHFDNCCSKQT